MAFIARIRLWDQIRQRDEEKLRILQRYDLANPWLSLDERRRCTVCGKIISGHEVQVIGRPQQNEPLRVACPTKHCCSLPLDWITP
jgi:hypothetical protein